MEPVNQNKTILLADDEQFIVIAYKDGLERAGYAVDVAHDGNEVLSHLQTSQPNLILLDLIMPNLNGFEVLKSLKNDPNFATIPVMVLSNLSQPDDEAEARNLGAIDFIVKSDISLKDLLARIERVFL
jgi:two-component system, OmpR family, alkaline phosphatase synthesis response regulator PhoP